LKPNVPIDAYFGRLWLISGKDGSFAFLALLMLNFLALSTILLDFQPSWKMPSHPSDHSCPFLVNIYFYGASHARPYLLPWWSEWLISA
jgi:hypothetical protein